MGRLSLVYSTQRRTFGAQSRMMRDVRVRFAPSPTGPLHIGGLRTALYNYLFAKKNNGAFVVRVEDTDRNRLVPGSEAYIFKALEWCRIKPDESPINGGDFKPYRQSERMHLYADCAARLVTAGHAYYAFDKGEELAALRQTAEAKGSAFTYGVNSRMRLQNSLALSDAEVAKRKETEPYVIRFKTPRGRTVFTRDLVRGKSEIDSALLDDKILYKSDGMPTYHLAHVVDDHLMRISHVIRGAEWLPSLALHQLLYEAFGWQAPEFAHLPLILKPFGPGKLSKRDGDQYGFPVFPLEWQDPKTGKSTPGYEGNGYFPEALVNMLALLGWNPGTERELFSLAELETAFSLERVNKSSATFDPDKAVWFNRQYLQKKSDAALARDLAVILKEKNVEKPLCFIEKVVSLTRMRADFVRDMFEGGNYFFTAPDSYEKKAAQRLFKPESIPILQSLAEGFARVGEFSREALARQTESWVRSRSLGLGAVMPLLRLSLVGALQGPDVFEIAALLGKAECSTRLKAAISFVSHR